jgi:hypothetical protein
VKDVQAQRAVVGDPALQLVGRAVRDDLTVVDDEHAVAKDVGFLQVVRGEENRGAEAVPQAADVVPQVGAALRVQARGGLVEEDQRRLVHEAERDLQPSPLPAGQGLHQPVAEPSEVELLGQQLRALVCLGLAEAVQGRLVEDFLGDRALVVGAAHGLADRLRHEADPAADPDRIAEQVRAGDGRRARGRLQQRGEHPERGSLAAPFGPRKPTISPSDTLMSTPRTACTVLSRPVGPDRPPVRFLLLKVRARPLASMIDMARIPLRAVPPRPPDVKSLSSNISI